jgi:uncharacterized protein YggE
MAADDEQTQLSVRGEARGVVAPDQASLSTAVIAVEHSKAAAASAAAATLNEVVAELTELGGEVLAVDSARRPLTWSTHSVQTYEEYEDDRGRGTPGRSGRYRASVNLLISVRDFALLDAVNRVLVRHDELDVHFVEWSVDDDNPTWAAVRADAIRAALLKGQDYAAALGGSVVRVEHIADAGLLGGQPSGFVAHDASGAMALSAGGGAESVSLDPVPQVLKATIEARLAAIVGPLPAR